MLVAKLNKIKLQQLIKLRCKLIFGAVFFMQFPISTSFTLSCFQEKKEQVLDKKVR